MKFTPERLFKHESLERRGCHGARLGRNSGGANVLLDCLARWTRRSTRSVIARQYRTALAPGMTHPRRPGD